jgi:very-short-patch-repair endonuclease
MDDERSTFRGSEAVRDGQISWKRLCGPNFVRLVRDVYLPRYIEVTHQMRCHAATLIAPEEAVVTGRSAATVRSVPLALPWDPVEIVVPERVRFGPIRGLTVRRTPLDTVDSRPWANGALATCNRLGLDLALRPSLTDAIADLDAALAAGLVDDAALRTYFAGRREHGICGAREALRLSDARSESRPESRLRVILALAGIELTPQVVVTTPAGEFVGRVDLGVEELRLAVEYDGMWHVSRPEYSRGKIRLNQLHAAGWRVETVTADQMRDPAAVVESIRTAIQQQRRAVNNSTPSTATATAARGNEPAHYRSEDRPEGE